MDCDRQWDDAQSYVADADGYASDHEDARVAMLVDAVLRKDRAVGQLDADGFYSLVRCPRCTVGRVAAGELVGADVRKFYKRLREGQDG